MRYWVVLAPPKFGPNISIVLLKYNYTKYRSMPTDLTALLAFVTDFQWIWNIKMTRIFIQDHLLNIPKEVID